MKILIVERHRALRNIMRDNLSQLDGFEVKGVDTASSAWSMIASDRPNLVICATLLTDTFTGLELLRKCRKDDRLCNLPFMLLAEDSTESVIAKAIELEVDDLLIKPFSISILQGRVTDLLLWVNSAEESLYREFKTVSNNDKIDEALDIITLIEDLVQLKLAKWIYTKGMLKYKKGDIDEALDLFKKSINHCRLYVASYDKCAEILIDQGNTSEAISYLETAHYLGYPNIPRSLSLGEMYLKTGDIENGKRIFSKLLTIEPDHASELMDSIIALYDKYNFENHIEDFYAHMLDQSEDFRLLNRLGILYRTRGNYRESESCYLRAIKLNPDSPVLYYNLGVLHRACQNTTRAKYFMNKALALDPEFKPALEACSSF